MTVGQYTGLTDSNGNRIFEGDMVEGGGFDAKNGYGVIKWDESSALWVIGNNDNETDFDHLYPRELTVIGNIHEKGGGLAPDAPPPTGKGDRRAVCGSNIAKDLAAQYEAVVANATKEAREMREENCRMKAELDVLYEKLTAIKVQNRLGN